jgi:rhodanese-related sulfurtransferase
MLAKKLVDRGFDTVTVLDEGLGFWKMKGYPVRSGGAP